LHRGTVSALLVHGEAKPGVPTTRCPSQASDLRKPVQEEDLTWDFVRDTP
jgi:hypothetical protein